MAGAINLSELNFDNIGSWPMAVKAGSIAIVCALLVFAVYWFDTSSQLEQLDNITQQERKLRQKFEIKQHHAANLSAYQAQLRQMRSSFGAMLRQLPSKTELPGLLEDISKTGLASGLEFDLFDPLDEVTHDFYAELPITISVVGDYHEFGQFVSRIANLSRIVTLHDFDIGPKPQQGQTDKTAESVSKKAPLQLQITAKTYRYVDGGDT